MSQLQVTLYAVACAAGAAFLFWRYWNKPENKDLPFDFVVRRLLVQHTSSIFMAVNVLTVTGESLMAAGAIGDARVNTLARFITHFTIGFLCLIGALNIFKSLGAFMQDMREKKYGQAGIQFAIFMILCFLTLIAPCINTVILAHSFHQSAELNLFISSMNPWVSQNKYIYLLVEAGKSMPYSPWGELHSAIAASVALNFITFLIVAYEGLHNWYVAAEDSSMGRGIVGEGKKEDKKGEEEEDEKDSKDDPNTKTVMSNVEQLLKFYFTINGTVLDAEVKAISDKIRNVIKGRQPTTLMATVTNSVVLNERIREVGNNPDKIKKLKEDIAVFISSGGKSANVAEGLRNGFGVSLPKLADLEKKAKKS